MTNKITANDVPTDPHARHSWVLMQFHLRKMSLNKTAKAAGLNVSSLSRAFHLPSIRCEAVLAEALGLKPHQLFPERYDAFGNRAPHLVRNQHSFSNGRGNAKSAGGV